jgi:hypothetical protein
VTMPAHRPGAGFCSSKLCRNRTLIQGTQAGNGMARPSMTYTSSWTYNATSSDVTIPDRTWGTPVDAGCAPGTAKLCKELGAPV